MAESTTLPLDRLSPPVALIHRTRTRTSDDRGGWTETRLYRVSIGIGIGNYYQLQQRTFTAGDKRPRSRTIYLDPREARQFGLALAEG